LKCGPVARGDLTVARVRGGKGTVGRVWRGTHGKVKRLQSGVRASGQAEYPYWGLSGKGGGLTFRLSRKENLKRKESKSSGL